jgi:tetratricopeptide (TPR) repeat protein
VVSALKVKLVAGQEPSSRSRRTDNAEVYSLYLQGRDQFNRSTLDGYRAAASTFQKALDLDPGFAPAWAGLAHATYWIADSGDSAQEIEQGQRKATAAAEKAVALGPDLPAGYIARGAIRSAVLRDWPGAQADFERALALSPQNADALRDYTIYVLRPLGKAEEGLAAARRAAELDPLNGRSWTTVASFLIALGRYAEARAALERSLQVNAVQSFAPGWLCVDLILEGQPAAALAAGQRSTSDVFRLTCIAMAQRALGNAAAANEALQTLTTKFGHSGAYQIAVVFAHAGDPDRAFEWLERARVQNDGGLALIKLDPQLRALRGDPRYAALLRKLDLPP